MRSLWPLSLTVLLALGNPAPTPAQAVPQTPRVTLEGHRDGIFCVAFSPDGRSLASASRDHTIKVLDVSTCRERHTLKGHTNQVLRLTFSPDGHRLISGCADNTAKVWDVAGGKELLTLKGHAAAPTGGRWRPPAPTRRSGSGTRPTVRSCGRSKGTPPRFGT